MSRGMASRAKSECSFRIKEICSKGKMIKVDVSENEGSLARMPATEKKQVINEACVLCGTKPCDHRLVCAHSIHYNCFLKSPLVPKCHRCESKNMGKF